VSFTTRIGGSGPSSVCFIIRIGGPVDLKAKSLRGPGGFESGFGALGGREQSTGNWTLRLRSYGYMAK
jgi:hypothetical protein